ncbi:MAG: Crp/Fnr family transcriptional regulator [Chitinivibrionales bacterium]|nr:Crp/Fnr family transcriptional regulator [Chitinivibrionales bacterium]
MLAVNTLFLLEQSDFFRSMSSLSKEKIAAICAVKNVQKKELLFQEDQDGYAIYINATASIQLFKTDESGKPIVVRICHRGDLFGEVILFEQNTYPVNALALKAGIVLVIQKQLFLTLLDDSQFRNSFIRDLMKKQRYLTEKIQQLSVYDVEQRFFAFLFEHFGSSEHFSATLTKKNVAEAIGSSAETFSRMLQRLKKEKICTWEKGAISLASGFWKQWFR